MKFVVQLVEYCGEWLWLFDCVVLGEIYFEVCQVIEDFLVFDEFGYGYCVQVVGDLVDGVDDGLVYWVFVQVVDEVVVDFDYVDDEIFQVIEGIQVGVEVVQCYFVVEVVQFGDDL